MEAGIIGLPYIGKTTLFNALTALGVRGEGAGNKPNVGVVNVPDARLATLNRYIETKKIVPAQIQLVDVAGLVAGASEGKGTGNKFLAHLRNVDALLHLVRCFDDPGVPHVNDTIDPVRDVEEVETELLLADLEVVENSLNNAERRARTGDKEAKARVALMQRCREAIEAEKPIRSVSFSPDDRRALRSFALLSAKPVLYVANVGEDDVEGKSDPVTRLRDYAAKHGSPVVPICAKLEAELVELDESERAEMLTGLGIAEPALNVLARETYKLLGLQSYFTAGEKEIKAWTIPIGATAPAAAGVIHGDFERGFIRVEVHSVADLEKYKTEKAIKEAGKLRVEGKSYVMQDGDVCHFLFNV